jgi:hypothetical protein
VTSSSSVVDEKQRHSFDVKLSDGGTMKQQMHFSPLFITAMRFKDRTTIDKIITFEPNSIENEQRDCCQSLLWLTPQLRVRYQRIQWILRWIQTTKSIIFGWLLIIVFKNDAFAPNNFVYGLQQSPLPTGIAAAASNSNTATHFPPLAADEQTQVIITSTKKNGGHTLRFLVDELKMNEGVTTAMEASVGVDSNSPIVETSGHSSHPGKVIMTYFRTIQRYWKNLIVFNYKAFLRQEYWQSLYHRIQSGWRSTFLPIGYPHTVPDQYASYVLWACIQDLSTSIRSVLATQHVLQGIGVGQNTATTLSAIQNFMLRDAAGMFSTLSFTAISSSLFSKDVKRWRIFADCMVDIGITLEVMAIQLPKSYFVPVLCIANMCKAMCGVAAGATSGSIALYWSSKVSNTGSSSRNSIRSTDTSQSTDISDINAKFGAQNTITGSLGLVFSAIFAKSVATAPLSIVWILYSMLTALHIYANTQCMRIIAFPQFNTVRFNQVVTTFFNQRYTSTNDGSISTITDITTNDEKRIHLPTPQEIAKIEPLFFFVHSEKPLPCQLITTMTLQRRRRLLPIYFGVSFNEFMERSGMNQHHLRSMLIEKTTAYPYLISIGTSPSKFKTNTTKDNCCIVVALPSNTNAYVQAQAYFHATLFRHIINELSSHQNQQPTSRHEDFRQFVESKVHADFPLAWQSFATECDKAGWDLSRSELHSNGYEISFQ